MRRVADLMERTDRPRAVIGGIESVLGLLRVEDLGGYESGLLALYFGAEDWRGNCRPEEHPRMEVLCAPFTDGTCRARV